MSEAFGSGVLAGKNAVITGGGSGINLAIARRFAEHGARVALIGRTREKLPIPDSDGQILVVFHPQPGTDSARALDLLRARVSGAAASTTIGIARSG